MGSESTAQTKRWCPWPRFSSRTGSGCSVSGAEVNSNRLLCVMGWCLAHSVHSVCQVTSRMASYNGEHQGLCGAGARFMHVSVVCMCLRVCVCVCVLLCLYIQGNLRKLVLKLSSRYWLSTLSCSWKHHFATRRSDLVPVSGCWTAISPEMRARKRKDFFF